jgi:hypothetical protein
MSSLATVRLGSTLTLFALALFAGGCAPESDTLEDADTPEALSEESQALGHHHSGGELVLQKSPGGAKKQACAKCMIGINEYLTWLIIPNSTASPLA